MKRFQSFTSASVALVFASLLAGCGTTTPTAKQSTNTSKTSGAELANTASSSRKTADIRDSTSSRQTGSSSQHSNSSSLNSISMVNSAIGWATDINHVWYTPDGGATWRNVTPSGMDASVHWQVSLYSLDATHAWVAVTQPTHNWTTIYRTSDGGKSWTKSVMQGVGGISTIHFTDLTHGWLSFEQGGSMGRDQAAIYQTVDGGRTWQKISVTENIKGGTIPSLGIKTGVTFTNDNNGWLTGYTYAHGNLYLYRTTDDGHLWSKQPIPLPPRLHQAQLASYPPVFFNQMDGVLPVEVFGGPLIVYRTSDGGARWTPTSPVTAKEQGTEAQGWKFDFVSTNIGFASNGDELFATKNGGQTWGRVASNTMPGNVQDLDFTSNNDGFALTAKGNVYHTSDGGSTWEQVN